MRVRGVLRMVEKKGGFVANGRGNFFLEWNLPIGGDRAMTFSAIPRESVWRFTTQKAKSAREDGGKHWSFTKFPIC